jgi:hypothetical protein
LHLKETQHRVSVIRGVVEYAPAFINDLRRQDPFGALATRLQLEVAAGGGHGKSSPRTRAIPGQSQGLEELRRLVR